MDLVTTAIAAFHHWRGARPERVEILTGGLRNAMVRVDEWVIRFYLHDALVCEREAAVLRLLAGESPVPELVHASTGNSPTPARRSRISGCCSATSATIARGSSKR